ncbi:hypothetical protein BASA61_001385 [Batrachochytrium salamandrivorans]|nr:hypothetical protein BASA61_001385 [Batrachochytrium salamandrivorans]
MWIDTAGTLPAGSQLTVASSTRLSCLIPHIFMLHSPVHKTNAGPDLLRHLRLHRGAKYIHFPHPDRVRDPSNLSRDF